MRLWDLFEDEPSDHAAREEAEQAHRALTDWLSRHEDQLEHRLGYSGIYGGSYVLPLRRARLQDDLVVVFAPKGATSGFGSLKDGRKAIVVANALIGPGDLRHLPTRFGSGAKRAFIHEYIHYLLGRRRTDAPNSARLHTSGDTAAYYNDPDELNAYYQEAASDLWRTILAIAPYGVAQEKFGPMTTPQWVEYALTRHFDEGFLQALTPANLRRIKKRLARFVDQTLRPTLRQGGRLGE